MTTNDQITVSESIILVLSPAICQTNLGITNGSVYRLRFNATITDGVLKAYQGSQLIYASNEINLGFTQNVYDSVILSEMVYTNMNFYPSVFIENIEIEENITLTIE